MTAGDARQRPSHALTGPGVHEWTYPWSSPPLSLNQRLHRMQAATITKQLRANAAEAAIAARVLPMERCRVELIWHVTTRTRRDDENPVPTLKALCDGLVDAEVVRDDTAEYMEKLMPSIRYRPKKDGPACMVLRVTELPGETGRKDEDERRK